MRAIMLCAGKGERLRDLTGGEDPKCLVRVDGRPIIDWQIDAMSRSGIKKMTIVTGFKAEKIRSYLTGDGRIDYVNNEQYNTTNILTSFRLALKDDEELEDLVVMAGDVVFAPEILKKMVEYEEVDIVVAIDSSKIDSEAVKVEVKGDRVTRFGKDLDIAGVQGQFLGLMKVSAGTVGVMKELVNRMVLFEGHSNGYLFDMLNTMIGEYGKKVGYLNIGSSFWEEIDFKEDWQRANEALKGKGHA